ncbi:hypothetical protein [Gordonia polyisoprenivorans]|uniref:hypothetical protein n=1 Tax=Gordonia polyisoprenivorans TaxID=84595 RepID=UPI002301BD54|nr:hypothetical protein [Gordonia polyisoprenivorans]WCB37919.1 hypothetical protein PHA63_01790 [Gordonia polyisoprenivorans]
MTDDEFFTATDQLRTIRDWAHARYAAAWAVLLQVLVRVSVSTDPNVQLPGVIGGRASLNLLAAFVSPSGGGKGISDKVARLAWPAPIIERPIGSGEGIAATFVPPKREGVEPITRALITVPEIDTLAGLAGRQGSILLAQLKSMAMGEQLGQSNASEATTRIIPEHSYRACMSVGAQPAHCSVIFSDTTGGTPQRFLWAMTIDPEMPEDAPDDPEPLDTRLPLWAPGMDGVVEIGYGPDEIPAAIKAAHIARQRGEADALDGHAMLTRCKVAAVLAILHHRSVVSELDWALSGAVMEQSDRTRDWVIAEGKRAARQKVRERALARAAGDEVYDERLLDRVKRSLLRMLDTGGEQAGNTLRSRLGKREKRDLFDQAIGELVAEGLAETISVERGTRYRGLNGQGDLTGQGAKPQVSVGDRSGQGDQVSVTSRVTGDSSVQIIHAVGDSSLEVPRPSSVAWFRAHIAGLIAQGVTTVESRDVYAAGQTAGYSIDSLRQAATKSDLIATIARTAGSATWRLGAGNEDSVITCTGWLLGWLREQDGWVRAADGYTAGQAAGYGRTAIKSAAKDSPAVLKRGSSVATEWCLDPNHSEERSA